MSLLLSVLILWNSIYTALECTMELPRSLLWQIRQEQNETPGIIGKGDTNLSIQRSVIEYGRGAAGHGLDYSFIPLSSKTPFRCCRQDVRSTGYQPNSPLHE